MTSGETSLLQSYGWTHEEKGERVNIGLPLQKEASYFQLIVDSPITHVVHFCLFWPSQAHRNSCKNQCKSLIPPQKIFDVL